MKTSKRFENAITRLYTAFHSNTLDPENCAQCAVGTILNNKDSWKHLTDLHGSTTLNYVGLVHENLGRKFNDYTPLELLKIEASFLEGCGYRLGHNICHKPDYLDKDILFNGLCAVVSTLCQLDGINDIMNCNTLFKYQRFSSKQNTLNILKTF